MNVISGRGFLRHGFFGTYIAAVGIDFKTADHAEKAKQVLGNSWKEGEVHPHVLTWQGEREELNKLKEQLNSLGYQTIPCGAKGCKHQCKNAPIDNVNHSIDFGANFTITIPL